MTENFRFCFVKNWSVENYRFEFLLKITIIVLQIVCRKHPLPAETLRRFLRQSKQHYMII